MQIVRLLKKASVGVGALGFLLLAGCSVVSNRLDFTASPSEGQAPLAVTFSPVYSGAVESYAWNLGDGATSSEQSPTHTYVSAGLYTVRLTVIPSHGAVITATKAGLVRVLGDGTSSLLFWGERGTGQVSAGDRAGTHRAVVVDGLISPEDLALAGGRLYWVDSGTGTVESANLNGTERRVVATGLHSPTGIAVDRLRGKIYWTCPPSLPTATMPRDGVIQRANLDGTSVETLASFSPESPFAWQIALDCVAEKLYWISFGWDVLNAGTCAAAIVSADLSARHPTPLVSGLCEPTDVTTDGSSLERAQHVYWTSEEPGVLVRVGVEGGSPETVVSGIPGAESLAVDPLEERVYWTADTALRCAHLDGSGVTDLFTVLDLPEGMAIDR